MILNPIQAAIVRNAARISRASNVRSIAAKVIDFDKLRTVARIEPDGRISITGLMKGVGGTLNHALETYRNVDALIEAYQLIDIIPYEQKKGMK